LVELRRQAVLAKRALTSLDMPVLCVEASNDAQRLRVRFANMAACKVFERTDSEIFAAEPATLFADADVPKILGLIANKRNGELQLKLRPKFGEPIPLTARIDGALVENATLGLPKQAILTFSHQASVTRSEVGAVLNERVNAELESFSYTVSHDLRAPIRSVEGFARILQEDYGSVLDRAGCEYLQRISLAALRMNQMIDALLELSRLSTQPLVRQPVDLAEIGSAILDEFAIAEPLRRVRSRVQPKLIVWGDPSMLRIALSNLLSNAWKFTGRMSDPAIELTELQINGESVFCVADNGVGFDHRYSERLFGPFQRLHSQAEFPGSGVGLATVKRVISRHGGRIWAESEINRGTRFFFTLGQRSVGRNGLAAFVSDAMTVH
jgi:signal transduction histidine kinase